MSESSPPLRGLAALLLALALAAVSMSPTLDGGFVWDDVALVLENKAVTEGIPVADHFTEPFWVRTPESDASSNFYRPLTALSYAIDYRVHGPNPVGFRLTNLLAHLINVGLLFHLARRLGAPLAAASLAAAAWGTNPRLCESVAWIAGRTDVLAVTGILLSLVLFRPESSPRTHAAFVVAALGLFFKETAAAALVGLAVGLALHRVPDAKRTRWIPLAVGAALTIGYVGLRVAAFRGLADLAPDYLMREPKWRVIHFFEAIGQYAWMIVDPWQPRTQIGYLGFPDDRFVAAGAVLLGVVGVVGWRFRRSWRSVPPLGAAVAVTGAVSLGMVLHIVIVRIDVVAADRYLYAPLACLAALAASASRTLVGSRARAIALAGAVLVGTLSVRCWTRTWDWTSELRLWVEARTNSPRMCIRPQYRLAALYFTAALYEDALALYTEGERISEDNPWFVTRLRFETSGRIRTLIQLGRTDEAASVLEKAIARLTPEHRTSFVDVEASRVEVAGLRFERATDRLVRVVRAYPDYGPGLGLLLGAGQGPALLEAYETARRADPRGMRTLWTCGSLFSMVGRGTEAAECYRELVERPDAPPEAVREAAMFLARFGPADQAPRALDRSAAVLAPTERETLEAVARERAAQRADLIAARAAAIGS